MELNKYVQEKSKKKKAIIVSVIIVFLLVVGLVIYKTYALYEERASYNSIFISSRFSYI